MMNEALIIGIVIAILCGAACLYLYYCISYLEKKMGMMESILVDVRMTLDSLLLSDRPEGEVPPVPIASAAGGMPPPMPAATVFTAPEPMAASEAEPIPEEKFYSSVLEQAHEAAAEDGAEGSGPEGDGSQSLEQVLQSIQEEGAGLEAAGAAAAPVAPAAPAVGGASSSYDALTRAELLALAEKRGVRVKRSSSRSEIIGVLRRTEPSSIAPSSTGTENGSEPAGSLFPSSGSMDSGFPVDLGQAEPLAAESE